MKKGQKSLVQRPMVIHLDEIGQESHRVSKYLPAISVYRESTLPHPCCQEIRNKGLQGLTDPGEKKLITLNNSGTMGGIM